MKSDNHKHKHSSYWMHDPSIVFNEIGLVPGALFLDLGCGAGDYSIKASEIVGSQGKVFSLDISENAINSLKEIIGSTNNIIAITTDITSHLPIEDHCVDAALLSTVLHAFEFKRYGINLFNEIRRVLKPGGRVVIIECKKEKLPFGPPLNMRLSEEEITPIVLEAGFLQMSYINLGFNYCISFITK